MAESLSEFINRMMNQMDYQVNAIKQANDNMLYVSRTYLKESPEVLKYMRRANGNINGAYRNAVALYKEFERMKDKLSGD